MHKKTELTKALTLAFGGSMMLGMLAPAAHAQRVEITGSSIRQISSETALPVTVLKTEDLARAGVTNAEQALAFITSNQSTINSAASVGGPNGGASYADLRGLGAGRTLVLVNGKRMVNNPYDGGIGTAVDLNTIPYGAVERIEVLNDGASSIYGSDAVAGVINFITRRDYQGLTLEGSLSQPTSSGGGQSYDVGATAGIGSLTEQGWNLFGSVNFRGQASLRANDRSFSNSAYIPNKGVDFLSAVSSPANYYQGDLPDLFNPSLPDCNPPTSYPVDGFCGFNYVRYTDTVPQQYQLNLYAKGSYAIDTQNTLSLEYLQGNNKLTTRVAPTPFIEVPMPSTNPFFPGGARLPTTRQASIRTVRSACTGVPPSLGSVPRPSTPRPTASCSIGRARTRAGTMRWPPSAPIRTASTCSIAAMSAARASRPACRAPPSSLAVR
jgi:iron complex outermembrane recepter protein